MTTTTMTISRVPISMRQLETTAQALVAMRMVLSIKIAIVQMSKTMIMIMRMVARLRMRKMRIPRSRLIRPRKSIVRRPRWQGLGAGDKGQGIVPADPEPPPRNPQIFPKTWASTTTTTSNSRTKPARNLRNAK